VWCDDNALKYFAVVWYFGLVWRGCFKEQQGARWLIRTRGLKFGGRLLDVPGLCRSLVVLIYFFLVVLIYTCYFAGEKMCTDI
jgi:hypothetical protein